TLLRPRSTMSDLIVTDPARVRADYGIEPSQYVDFAAMRGDASDGLRGVHGIGPKIAARLLRDHGTIEELYANLHHLLPVHEAKLRAGQAEVDRNLALMTPITSVEVDVMASIAVGLDPGTLDANLVGLGLNRAAGQLRRAMSERQLPPMPPMPQEAPQDIVALPAARTFALVDASEQDALF
ncbi:MAG: 5'-3' exonuclease, partial [Nonlabens sp.]